MIDDDSIDDVLMDDEPEPKRGTGRPKADIDWTRVGKMLEAGCFSTGIAATLGISEDTLTRRCETDNKMTFAEFRQQKRAKGDDLLRQVQFQSAVGYTDVNGNRHEPNTTMQIWLGKQRLDQTEKSANDLSVRGEIGVGFDQFKQMAEKMYGNGGDQKSDTNSD